MKIKSETSNIKSQELARLLPGGPKSLGPVPDLEEHVQPDWWRYIFNSIYLKTDGDVIDDAQITAKEIDVFSDILKLSPQDRILDLCCGQGRAYLEAGLRQRRRSGSFPLPDSKSQGAKQKGEFKR